MGVFIRNLRSRFSSASMLMRFIYINIAVFLILRIIGLGCILFNIDPFLIVSYVEVPSALPLLLERPWTILTYMFAQYDFLHILFNMLWLYFFGMIFLDFLSSKQFVGLYIIGGITGAILYIAAYNLFPYFYGQQGLLMGSSASVIAIVVAISMRMPNYKMNLLFLGGVSLKWIAIITILIDVLSISSNNSGGHIAHIGGAIAGIIFVLLYRRGTDITHPITVILDAFTNLFRKRPKFAIHDTHYSGNSKAKYHYSPLSDFQDHSTISKEEEDNLDVILDKIKKSGYTSLTDDEKKRLFEISNNSK